MLKYHYSLKKNSILSIARSLFLGMLHQLACIAEPAPINSYMCIAMNVPLGKQHKLLYPACPFLNGKRTFDMWVPITKFLGKDFI